MHKLKIMWEYKTEEFKVERNSDGKYKIQTANLYEVKLKRRVE